MDEILEACLVCTENASGLDTWPAEAVAGSVLFPHRAPGVLVLGTWGQKEECIFLHRSGRARGHREDVLHSKDKHEAEAST